MSGGEGRKLSNQDIQLVQNRIEQCLQLYKNKQEVMNILSVQDKIDPGFTDLVWQRLEQENQEFFKAYYLKLLVKDQISEFNRLLAEQVALMHQIGFAGISPMLTSNGSHVSPTQQISTPIAAQNTRPLKTEAMLPLNMFNNCGASMQPCLQGNVDGTFHGRKIEVSPSLFLSQNTNMGFSQTMSGTVVKADPGYAGSAPFNFNPPTNFLESRPLMGDASVSSFSSVESNAHINEALLDGDTTSFGFLQIPQNFGLPDLTADFTTSSGLLESYIRPPFLTTDANNFVDPQGDIERLDPAPESLSYQCFGGD